MIASQDDKYVDGFLNHPSQRVLINRFKEKGIKVTERHIGQYFEAMGDELHFVNQKKGFVYADREVA